MTECNHNTIYHNQIIGKLSDSKNNALDIGSGLGLFTMKSIVWNQIRNQLNMQKKLWQL